MTSDNDKSDHVIRSALTPGLRCATEKPPESEDFKTHCHVSLSALKSLVNAKQSHNQHILLLLCSEHCALNKADTPHVWSSTSHQELADELVQGLESLTGKTLIELLTEDQCNLFKSLMAELQPRLEKFSSHPASVASLSWLVSKVPHPQLSELVPRLLPHLLNITDSWMPHYKMAGARLMGHVIKTCPSSELLFYGRAELLEESLVRLLGHTDSGVVKAASEPLLALTSIRHGVTRPSEPGPGDHLMQELVTKLELATDRDRREVLAAMIEQLVHILGIGVARWVTSLARTIISLLAFSPPLSVFRIVSSITRMCPECVSREVGDLLPALVKFVYQLSWREQQDHNSGAVVSLASVCILELATCDPEAARLLCHDLENLPPVNPTFDTLVTEILSVITAV